MFGEGYNRCERFHSIADFNYQYNLEVKEQGWHVRGNDWFLLVQERGYFNAYIWNRDPRPAMREVLKMSSFDAFTGLRLIN